MGKFIKRSLDVFAIELAIQDAPIDGRPKNSHGRVVRALNCVSVKGIIGSFEPPLGVKLVRQPPIDRMVPRLIHVIATVCDQFRRHTLLPLDDCPYALQPSIPYLTRSSLHRCLQRHNIWRLPEVDGDKSRRQRFKRYPTGFFHIDTAEVQTAEAKLHLFVAIDRTSKFAVAQLVETADRRTAWEFVERVLGAVPYQIHTILTDRAIGKPLVRQTMARGILFAEQPRNCNTITSRPMRFDMICAANGIEHRLTKPNHLWSHEDQKTVRGAVFLNGGQVERMNRTIKHATVKRYHHDNHVQLRIHLADFLAAYTFGRRLKILGGLTP